MKYSLYFIILVMANVGREAARKYLDPEGTFTGSLVEMCFTVIALTAFFSILGRFKKKVHGHNPQN